MQDSKIAVVGEDDPDVRELIELVLTQSGFSVVVAEDGPAAIEAVRVHDPVLTTLDINMPGLDGFAAAKQIRAFSHTYLIMITSMTEEIDVIRGFEAGADDYLVKPFRPRELRARADSMLRRAALWNAPDRSSDGATEAAGSPIRAPAPESWAAAATRELIDERATPGPPAPASAGSHHQQARVPAQEVSVPAERPGPSPTPEVDDDGQVLRFQALTMEPATGRAALEGRSVDLTRPEADLLVSLMRSGRRVRSKADLVLVVRGHQFVTSHFVNEADKRSVERHVLSLIRKLGDDGPTSRYIEIVRGVGYRMVDSAI